jgi:hypothetical protein
LHNFSATTPSIKSVINSTPLQSIPESSTSENIANEPAADLGQKRTNYYSQAELSKAFNKYVESIKESRPRYFSALSGGLETSSDNKLTLAFSNQNLEDDFNKNVRPEMLRSICNELLNDTIVIETRILEQAEGAKLFTPEDKFKHLASKNPALGRLKQQFNLDIE